MHKTHKLLHKTITYKDNKYSNLIYIIYPYCITTVALTFILRVSTYKIVVDRVYIYHTITALST